MAKYRIKEDGADGSVDVEPHKIIRRYKRRLRRDDKLEIPMHHVKSVHRDHRIGADEVVLKVRDAEYKWKIAGGDDNAQKLVDEIRHFHDA